MFNTIFRYEFRHWLRQPVIYIYAAFFLIIPMGTMWGMAAEASSSVLGNYMGLSLETPDMDKSAQLFEILDFKAVMGSAEQGWVVFQNADGLGISLMKPMSCPHLFFNPSLTYFNGQNNLAVIEKIRALDIPITEEITHFNEENKVDNIIIRDPGGLGFFLFSDR